MSIKFIKNNTVRSIQLTNLNKAADAISNLILMKCSIIKVVV